MLPPVDPSVLKANPKFEALYRDLCKHKLNRDGTSKLTDRAQKDRDNTVHDLRRLRIEAAKADIIRHGLSKLAVATDTLPDELQELVEVLSALLNGEVTKEHSDVVDIQLGNLQRNARKIAKALSTQLQHDLDILASIIDPDNPPRITEIPSAVLRIKSSISDLSEELAVSRLSLNEEVAGVQSLQREVMEASIRLLEQSIYGLVARSSKAKAEYLALMSEGMAKKLTLQHDQFLSQLYNSEFTEILSEKCEDLELEIKATRRKIDKATKDLEAYDKESAMHEMVKEYADLKAETAKVEEEIARLEEGH